MLALHYKNISLIPKKSFLESRRDADTSVSLFGRKFKLPIMPANMATTISFELAEQLSENEYFYVLHRFYDYQEIIAWLIRNQNLKFLSISIGVQGKDIELINTLSRNDIRVDCVTIDIAHGFSALIPPITDRINSFLPRTKIIVGNIYGDKDSVKFCENVGADGIKVGLSFGAGCSTYEKTSFASPMFSCGLLARSHTNLPIIGDGGIRTHGDIAKAIRAGYTMVMAGGLFAACLDSPAENVCGKKHYYGSASAKNKGHNRHVEGREVLLDCNQQTYLQKLEEIQQDLQSAISYAGGKDLDALRNVEYEII